MGNQLLASKVVVSEEEPKIRAVPNLPTAICGIVAITERGPVGVATLCTSFDDYVATFGGHFASGGTAYDTAAVVEAFFNNGGTQLYVVRTTHYTDVTTPATKTSAAATLSILDRAGSPIATLKIDGKSEGTYANTLKIKINLATSGDATKFDLLVVDSGTSVVYETFPNLVIGTANATAARYCVTVINADPSQGGSRLIKATDLASATAPPANLPALGLSSVLASGSDGVASLADTDFVGSQAGKTGLYALDLVDNLTLLIVPGRATATVHNGMITYCEVIRSGQVFAILDPPAAQSATAMITYVKTTAAIQELTEFAAVYWPRVQISNPKKSVYGTTDRITVAPSGHIAGMFSRNDNRRPGGVYDPPAGPDVGVLFGVLDFETTETLDENKRDLVFPERINPITTYPGGPRFVDGARCLKSTSNFPTVAERRGVSIIERAIKIALQVYRHKNNTGTLRAGIKRTVENYLLSQMSFGAFKTTNPKTAFFTDFGDSLNPPSAANTITGRIGLATAKPAEYIVLRFSQDQRAAEAAANATS